MNNDEVFDPDQFLTNDDSILVNSVNKILENPDEGIKFIAKVLEKKKEKRYRRHLFRDYVRNDIIACFSKVNLPGELGFKRQLEQLSRKIDEISSIEDLKNKTFVGVGGGFSAGKSRFINSLLNFDDSGDGFVSLLPEDQGPTTSIPTFIVSSTVDEIYAVTSNCPKISLTFDEVQALAHQFYETYHFGFNQFISRLVVKTSKFLYKNMVLLDTPGYTKDNVGTIKEARDVEKAKEQLKMVDYLIWVIDPDEGGGLTDSDVKFISELGADKPITFVVNKCDKVSDDKVNEIIDHVKEVAQDSSFVVDKIFKYSSFEKKGYDREKLMAYLKDIDRINPDHNIKAEIEVILNEIQRVAENENREINLRLSELDNKIDESLNPHTIRALVSGQKMLMRKKVLLEKALKDFRDKKGQLDKVYHNCKIELDNSKSMAVRFSNDSRNCKIDAKKSIELLSKILEEKSVGVDSEFGKKYTDVYSYIYNDVASVIDSLNIANKTRIIKQLNSCLDRIYLPVLEPQLFGKTIVAFTCENINKHIFKNILVDDKLRISSSVITFFLPGNSKEIYVCNRTDNRRILNRNEYGLSNFLWQNDIVMNDIVKFYSVNSHCDYENIVFVYIPKYVANDSIFDKLSFMIDYVISDGNDSICAALCRKRNVKCVRLRKKTSTLNGDIDIDESNLASFLAGLNKRRINYLFSHKVRGICNDVLLELRQVKDDLQRQIEDATMDAAIADNDVMHSYITDLKADVRDCIQKQESKKQNARKCFDQLIEKSEKLEKLCADRVYLGENDVLLDGNVALEIVETCIGYKNLEMTKEYEFMRNLLQQLSPEKFFLLQLWNWRGYSSEVISCGIQKLRNEDVKYPLIRKLSMMYAEKMQIDVENIVKYIEHSVSYNSFSFDDCVLCGDYYLEGNIERAFSYYFRAAKINPNKIGMLCDKMLSVPDIYRQKRYLEDIAKLYDAKGMYCLANSISRNNEPVRKTRLYKIAAALGNDDAIVQLLSSYKFEYRKEKEKYTGVVMSLANYLLQKGIAVDMAREILGRIAYDAGDYLEAEQKWSGCETKHVLYELGKLYQFGKRDANGQWLFPADLAEAKNCFERAVKLGHPKADENLRRVNEWIEKNNIQQETRRNQRMTRDDYRRTVSRSGGSSDGCVPDGTMIYITDGKIVAVENVKHGDSILVFNHFTGKVETADVFAVISHGLKRSTYEVVTLIFSDGTRTSLVKAHCYFDVTLNRYVEICANNVEEFLGHDFIKIDSSGIKKVMLTDVEKNKRDVATYEIITSHCLNFVTDGILSASMYLDKWLNIFDFSNDKYKYDMKQISNAVSQYGMAKIEDFPALPLELFNIGNGQYFNAAIGLKKITYDDVCEISKVAHKYLTMQ